METIDKKILEVITETKEDKNNTEEEIIQKHHQEVKEVISLQLFKKMILGEKLSQFFNQIKNTINKSKI